MYFFTPSNEQSIFDNKSTLTQLLAISIRLESFPLSKQEISKRTRRKHEEEEVEKLPANHRIIQLHFPRTCRFLYSLVHRNKKKKRKQIAKS